MTRGVACFNAGSASLKFAVFVKRNGALVASCRGEVDELDSHPCLRASAADGRPIAERALGAHPDYAAVLGSVVACVEEHLAPARLAAVGHRVVHGGNRHGEAAQVTPELLAELEALSPLAPLHQPHNLAAIGAMARLHPRLPQVACFDTAFHLGSPAVARAYALPRALAAPALARYGFHGLSYEHIARTLPGLEPRARGRVVAAHLGSGASMCAMVDGRSVASTMGFSALDGLPSATRMRTLLADADPAARDAVDLFVYRIGRELGSLAAAAGGLDVLVFTGGIGEHAAAIRARVCEDAAWLGVRLDPAANAAGGPRLHAADSRVAVWVVPADEEAVIARQTRAVVSGGQIVRE